MWVLAEGLLQHTEGLREIDLLDRVDVELATGLEKVVVLQWLRYWGGLVVVGTSQLLVAVLEALDGVSLLVFEDEGLFAKSLA